MTTKKKPEQIFVGRSEPWSEPWRAFVRVFEEPNGDEFDYEVFTATKTPTKKSHGRFNLVIGPFRTMKGAEIFRDREGVNTVEEAERLANA